MSIVDHISAQLARSPFIAHPALKGSHAQTIISSLVPRRTRLLDEATESRIFNVAPDARVLAQCAWQADRASKPVLLIAHGLEGSVESSYMRGTAEKALAAGFSAIRLNTRSCGGTQRLTPLLYHAGLTEDLRQIIAELIEGDGFKDIYLASFSLGGNTALKLAGEFGREAPAQLRGVIAISPSIHLSSCADAIELRSNIVYHLNFLLSLRNKLRRQARLFPDQYDTSQLRNVWTIRQFDNAYTAPLSGFRDVADYYERASALPFIKHIAVPTLIIHAKDDPFIPFAPFQGQEVTQNPNIILLTTKQGGHVGFISARAESGDRYWAEHRAIEFVSMIDGFLRSEVAAPETGDMEEMARG